MKKLLLLAVLVLVAGSMTLGGGQTLAAGPWYVATTGNDAADCLSPATACLTIQAAIGKASSGDTVNVAAGTYYEHVTIDKSLTLQGEDRETTTIDGSGTGDVIYVPANYVTISGFTVTNGDNGIRLIPNWAIHHVTIRDVIITSNATEGIEAAHSRLSGAYHVIEDCIISNNGGMALYAHQFGYSIIRNCEVFGNGGGRALDAAWGAYTLITNNDVHDNAGFGIWLDSMRYTTVENNRSWNNGGGIGVGYVATNNTIRDNIVRSNGRGLEANWHDNRFYHNDVIANTVQACDRGSNIWDNGYPSGGNYWSDYTGVDTQSGAGQNVPGSDGIGDTPYDFSGGPLNCISRQDGYPLMSPWNYVDVTVDIKPGSDPNCIKATSRGRIPVAILGNSVDITAIDAGTIEIDDDDDAATPGVAPIRASFKDVDGDSATDLVLHFRTPALNAAGLLVDGNELFVTGVLTDGTPIAGSDTIFLAGGPNCFD